VSSGNTADWFWMPFGVVSGVGLGMGVLDFGGDRRRGMGSSGGEFAGPIVTNGDFVASLCGTAYSDQAVIWRGEWGGPRHSCVRWKSTCLKGKGLFLAWLLAFFGICATFISMGEVTYTHTQHNRFTALWNLSGKTRVSRY